MKIVESVCGNCSAEDTLFHVYRENDHNNTLWRYGGSVQIRNE